MPPRWRSALLIAGAFTAGAAVTGVGAAVTTRRSGQEQETRDGGSCAPHTQGRRGFSPVAAFAAFVAGGLLSAGVVLLAAPESGPDVRRRLARGARTAQEELSDIVEETRVALDALKKDARQALRRTALRLIDSIDATIAAVKHEDRRQTGPVHD